MTSASLVERIVDSLIEHFHQNVHDDFDDIFDDKNDDCTSTSPVLQHLMDQVITLSKETETSIALHLLQTYQTHVRPVVFGCQQTHCRQARDSQTTPQTLVLQRKGLSVLVHYERLVACIMAATDVSPHESLVLVPVERNAATQSTLLSLAQLLQLLACDLTISTLVIQQEQTGHGIDGNVSSDEHSQVTVLSNTQPTLITSKQRAQLLLPTLIRLMIHIDRLGSLQSLSSDDGTYTKALRHCAVAVLALYRPHIDPRHVCHSLEDALCQISKYWIPTKLDATDTNMQEMDLRLNETMDWESVSIACEYLETGHEDYSTGITNTQGNGDPTKLLFWEYFGQKVAGTTHDAAHEDLSSSTKEKQSYLLEKQLVLSSLNFEALAKDVRAHFFGRDMLADYEPEQRLSTRLHLGRTVSYTPMDEFALKPFQAIPSRLSAVLHFVSLLTSDSLSNAIVEELLPVCYQLLDATSYAHNALGAAIVYHFLKCEAGRGDGTATQQWTSGDNLAQNLLQMLDKLVTSCRDGPPLAIFGLTQRQLLLNLTSYKPPANASPQPYPSYILKRRSITHQWMTIFNGNRYQLGNYESDDGGGMSMLWALLAAAIVPLLHDHASDPSNPADGVEVGRLGLTALLSILALEPPLPTSSMYQMALQIRVAALVALHNLLLAAYPIMPRHGGKIQCSLLACIRHNEDGHHSTTDIINDVTSSSKKPCNATQVQQLAKRIAAEALVICGERSKKLLEEVIDNSQDAESTNGGMISSSDIPYDCKLRDTAKAVLNIADSSSRNEAEYK